MMRVCATSKHAGNSQLTIRRDEHAGMDDIGVSEAFARSTAKSSLLDLYRFWHTTSHLLSIFPVSTIKAPAWCLHDLIGVEDDHAANVTMHKRHVLQLLPRHVSFCRSVIETNPAYSISELQNGPHWAIRSHVRCNGTRQMHVEPRAWETDPGEQDTDGALHRDIKTRLSI